MIFTYIVMIHPFLIFCMKVFKMIIFSYDDHVVYKIFFFIEANRQDLKNFLLSLFLYSSLPYSLPPFLSVPNENCKLQNGLESQKHLLLVCTSSFFPSMKSFEHIEMMFSFLLSFFNRSYQCPRQHIVVYGKKAD